MAVVGHPVLPSFELVGVHGDRGRDGVARRHGGLDSKAQQTVGGLVGAYGQPRRARRGGRRGVRTAAATAGGGEGACRRLQLASVE
jgi:hypothetical protein